MEILTFLKYNSYYNRIVKKRYDLISDYEDNGATLLTTINNMSFNHNDGVTATAVVNYSNALDDPDYAIVSDVQEYDEVISRWFVIDMVRTRAGQYQVTLKRDLPADYYMEMINSPAFIEKANLTSLNPLIFTSENMTFNQIKTEHNLLKDKSGIAWLIGYRAKGNHTLSGSFNYSDVASIPAVPVDVNAVENWSFYDGVRTIDDVAQSTAGEWYSLTRVNGLKIFANSPSGFYSQKSSFTIERGGTVQRVILGATDHTDYGITFTTYGYQRPLDEAPSIATSFTNQGKSWSYYENLVVSEGQTAGHTMHSTSSKNELLGLSGKIIRFNNGKMYRVNLISLPNLNVEDDDIVTASTLGLAMEAIVRGATINGNYTFDPNYPSNTNSYKFNYSAQGYGIALETINEIRADYNITTGTPLSTLDAPYNVFAIPYGRIDVQSIASGDVTSKFTTFGEDDAIVLMNQIQVDGGQGGSSAIVYDAQILPYCPVPELIQLDGSLLLSSKSQYSWVTKTESGVTTKIGIILNIPYSKFHTTIQYNISPANTGIAKKLNNETKLYRMCSSNYSNYYEFSVEKNQGIDYFDVDCEYKVATPYIHLNPNYKGLYGGDFNTPLGLICGGDYSLGVATDAWTSYQIQNKNFQLSFDRTIQNMEVKNSIARTQDAWNVATGTIQGAAAGGIAGGMTGNPFIAAGGAVLGGATSLVGGLADMGMNERLRQEEMSYTKDQFSYSLGNIRALPMTLAKVSAFTPNNQIFPVLEVYDCTEEEKNALLNKIKYDGMTVMIVGRISDYMHNTWTYGDIYCDKPYVQARLIRFESPDGYSSDYHIINELNKEMRQGLYFEQE